MFTFPYYRICCYFRAFLKPTNEVKSRKYFAQEEFLKNPSKLEFDYNLYQTFVQNSEKRITKFTTKFTICRLQPRKKMIIFTIRSRK